MGDALAVDRATDILTMLRVALEQDNVDLCPLPGDSAAVQRAAIQADDLGAVLRAFTRLPDKSSWRVAASSHDSIKWFSIDSAQRLAGTRMDHLLLRRAFLAPNGARVPSLGVSELVIEVWDVLGGGEARADGEPHVAGTRMPRATAALVPYLRAEDWETLVEGRGAQAPALRLPHLLSTQDPIDVVYTWVDGSDSAWLERKASTLGRSRSSVNRTADAASRFIAHDELRYSLRSLELYAPWVRHIFLVTDAQRPQWLVSDHPRLTVVDHTEIFADPSVLPVYNSHAIESQLHHIEGLSDRYLYMNDDVFFGRAVPKELFFDANGISRFFLSRATLDVGPASARDLPVLSAAKQNAALLADVWGKGVTNKFKHTPHTQSRDVLAEMEQRLAEVFERAARSRIRHPDDHSIASALQHYYAFAIGRALPGPIEYQYVNISDPLAELSLRQLLRDRDRDVFCLNDTFADIEGHRHADTLMRWFLEAYFPLPSSFEAEDGNARP